MFAKFNFNDASIVVNKVTFGFYRQVIDGIDELILNGLYHGNLNLKSCYVDKNPTNGVVVVKLADFKAKGKKESVDNY